MLYIVNPMVTTVKSKMSNKSIVEIKWNPKSIQSTQ